MYMTCMYIIDIGVDMNLFFSIYYNCLTILMFCSIYTIHADAQSSTSTDTINSHTTDHSHVQSMMVSLYYLPLVYIDILIHAFFIFYIY